MVAHPLGALGVPALLAACGAPPAGQVAPADGTQPVTLSWIAKLKGIPQADVDAHVRQYKEARPNVTLDLAAVTETEDGTAKLTAYQASGTAIDVISSFAGVPLLRQLKGGYPLNDLIKRDKLDPGQIAPGAMRSVDVGGKILALPHAYGGNELAFVANKALFSRAGVPLPAADWSTGWTWPQLREALKQLTNLTASPPVAGTARFGQIFNVPPMFGARWSTDDGKTATPDTPEMVQAWTEYYDLVLKDRTTTFSPNLPSMPNGTNAFLAGQAATLTICCGVPTTTVRFKDQNLDWAFVPFPRAKAAVTDLGASNVAVWSQTKLPDEAWRFARWNVEEGRLATVEQRMPTLSKAIGAYIQQHYGATPDARANLLLQAPEYAYPQAGLWQSPASGEAQTRITAALADVQKGAKSVPAALGELKPQLQALLDQYRDL
jgi:ABC-type glycerol-3-phosphate transport system substrate-binding protein